MLQCMKPHTINQRANLTWTWSVLFYFFWLFTLQLPLFIYLFLNSVIWNSFDLDSQLNLRIRCSHLWIERCQVARSCVIHTDWWDFLQCQRVFIVLRSIILPLVGHSLIADDGGDILCTAQVALPGSRWRHSTALGNCVILSSMVQCDVVVVINSRDLGTSLRIDAGVIFHCDEWHVSINPCAQL